MTELVDDVGAQDLEATLRVIRVIAGRGFEALAQDVKRSLEELDATWVSSILDLSEEQQSVQRLCDLGLERARRLFDRVHQFEQVWEEREGRLGRGTSWQVLQGVPSILFELQGKCWRLHRSASGRAVAIANSTELPLLRQWISELPDAPQRSFVDQAKSRGPNAVIGVAGVFNPAVSAGSAIKGLLEAFDRRVELEESIPHLEILVQGLLFRELMANAPTERLDEAIAYERAELNGIRTEYASLDQALTRVEAAAEQAMQDIEPSVSS